MLDHEGFTGMDFLDECPSSDGRSPRLPDKTLTTKKGVTVKIYGYSGGAWHPKDVPPLPPVRRPGQSRSRRQE